MSKREVLVLVGFPGAGKSTYCQQLPEYTRINQDTLGNRDACLKAASEALDCGHSIVIDRCNHNRDQRRHWIKLAQSYGVDARCVFLYVDPEECIHRIHMRKDHPTIKEEMPVEKKREIVAGFYKSFEMPDLEEGFAEILMRRNG